MSTVRKMRTMINVFFAHLVRFQSGIIKLHSFSERSRNDMGARMRKSVALVCALSLTACAGAGANYQPIVDYKSSKDGGVNYGADLAECQQYAQRIDPAGQAMAGALIGGLLGLGMGALARGSFGTGSTQGVGTFLGGAGAAAGAAQGVGGGIQSQQQIIARCMTARGYTVLQ